MDISLRRASLFLNCESSYADDNTKGPLSVSPLFISKREREGEQRRRNHMHRKALERSALLWVLSPLTQIKKA